MVGVAADAGEYIEMLVKYVFGRDGTGESSFLSDGGR